MPLDEQQEHENAEPASKKTKCSKASQRKVEEVEVPPADIKKRILFEDLQDDEEEEEEEAETPAPDKKGRKATRTKGPKAADQKFPSGSQVSRKPLVDEQEIPAPKTVKKRPHEEEEEQEACPKDEDSSEDCGWWEGI